MKYFLSLFAFLLLQVSCNTLNGLNDDQEDDRSFVLMVSFDGFSYQYLERYDTPNFDEFKKGGSWARKMIPSFPSKTFPNHYTLVTGMYPGNHGLVDNTFYDRTRDQMYTVGNRKRVEDPYYYGGTPLWQLAQQNGMKSASFFWVGSEAPIKGNYPDYYYLYDGSISNETRIDQVMQWLEGPKAKRPQFITLYFSFTDDVGHDYGPYSTQMEDAVKEADRLLGLIMEGIHKVPLDVNVILVSDHGMYPMRNEPNTFIYFDEWIDMTNRSFVAINNGTHARIYSKTGDPEQLDSVYHVLSSDQHAGFSVYLKENFPDKWHYQNDRSGDLLLVADPGKYFILSGRDTSGWEENWGTHGYDPYVTDEMGAIFLAMGPAIKPGVEIDSFENINIYPFIAKILHLDATQVDGDPMVLGSLVVEEN